MLPYVEVNDIIDYGDMISFTQQECAIALGQGTFSGIVTKPENVVVGSNAMDQSWAFVTIQEIKDGLPNSDELIGRKVFVRYRIVPEYASVV